VRQLAHSSNPAAEPGAGGSCGEYGDEEPIRDLKRHRRRKSSPNSSTAALQSNIDLGIEVQPVSIIADPSLLDDLLSNLVDNALKYTPSGGSITVERRRTQWFGRTWPWKTRAPGNRGGGAPAGAAKVSTDCRIRPEHGQADWGLR